MDSVISYRGEHYYYFLISCSSWVNADLSVFKIKLVSEAALAVVIPDFLDCCSAGDSFMVWARMP